jgi:protein-tyrosine phosphatase
MAEAIFNNIKKDDSNNAFSAGTNAVKGSLTSKHSAYLIKEKFNVDISNRSAKQLDSKMLEAADIVLTMTDYMSEYIKRSFKEANNKVVFPLKKFVGLNGEVADPYGGSVEDYKITFNDLMESIKLLLEKLN